MLEFLALLVCTSQSRQSFALGSFLFRGKLPLKKFVSHFEGSAKRDMFLCDGQPRLCGIPKNLVRDLGEVW
jgi:hypothetical protein